MCSNISSHISLERGNLHDSDDEFVYSIPMQTSVSQNTITPSIDFHDDLLIPHSHQMGHSDSGHFSEDLDDSLLNPSYIKYKRSEKTLAPSNCFDAGYYVMKPDKFHNKPALDLDNSQDYSSHESIPSFPLANTEPLNSTNIKIHTQSHMPLYYQQRHSQEPAIFPGSTQFMGDFIQSQFQRIQNINPLGYSYGLAVKEKSELIASVEEFYQMPTLEDKNLESTNQFKSNNLVNLDYPLLEHAPSENLFNASYPVSNENFQLNPLESNNEYSQLTSEQIETYIRISDTQYKKRLKQFIENSDFKSESKSQTKSNINTRKRCDKIRIACPVPACQYQKLFKTMDYLKRHIKEQHGMASKMHYCSGIDEITHEKWGCDRGFKRLYQLHNHWKGERSLKKCNVPVLLRNSATNGKKSDDE